MEFVQFNALSIGSPQHRKRGADVSKPDEAPDRRPLNRGLALKPEAQFDKEGLHCFEVVHHDQDVVHLLDCHVLRLLNGEMGVPEDFTEATTWASAVLSVAVSKPPLWYVGLC